MAVFYDSGPRKLKIRTAVLCITAELIMLLPLMRGTTGREMGGMLSSALHLVLFLNPAVTCAVLYALPSTDFLGEP
jgi:hypothetical protein